MQPTPQKVVFNTRVDRFKALQIEGLFELFRPRDGEVLTVTAMADNVLSRPAIFKQNTEVAGLLNLVLTLKDGVVDKLEWKNNCFDMQACSIHDCKDTSVRSQTEAGFEVYHEEQNCLFSDCYTGSVAP